jgi:hypothetical protein
VPRVSVDVRCEDGLLFEDPATEPATPAVGEKALERYADIRTPEGPLLRIDSTSNSKEGASLSKVSTYVNASDNDPEDTAPRTPRLRPVVTGTGTGTGTGMGSLDPRLSWATNVRAWAQVED